MNSITIILEKGQNITAPHWSKFVLQKRLPVNLVPPSDDLAGNFYDKMTGLYLGTRGAKPGEKVYAATSGKITKNSNGYNQVELSEIEDLKTTHRQFQSDASTVYGESSSFSPKWKGTDELAFEMAAIAYIYTYRNRVAFGINSAKAIEYRNTNIYNRTGDKQKASWSLINAIRGGNDYSNGASYWDGPEQGQFPASVTTLHPPANPKNKSQKNWRLHMNELGWQISDADYKKWKKNVGSLIVAPQVRIATVGINKGKIKYISTAVYARSIFWKMV